MDLSSREIAELIARVRARWRRLVFFRAGVLAAGAMAAVVATGLALAYVAGRSTHALGAIGAITVVVALAVAIRALSPARRVPTDQQVARFIEEREPSLDDRLVSAVDVGRGRVDGSPPALAAAMIADAGRRAAQVEPSAIVESDRLRRSALQFGVSLLVLLLIVLAGRHTARRSYDALALSLFPAHVRLAVSPGDARVQAGSSLVVEARLAGNSAPVTAQLQRADGEGWVATEMPVGDDGTFRVRFADLGESFRYRVVVGALTSDDFDVTVVRPPRVTRVDVEYQYPPSLGLRPRIEEDAGDIYAPAGTNVRVIVHTDGDAVAGQLALATGPSLPLNPEAQGLVATLRVERDDSYRLRVADRDGMTAAGETEYFIRMLDDRPPDVRVMRPARDRSVTALEEIDVEAEAQDDFGVTAMELVFSVRGGPEQVAPFAIQGRAPTVSGRQTLYLEDLGVKPGDFISYYVRARDLPRGRRSVEARSDLFFLEVKPYEQEFSLAQSQGGGAGGSAQLDDLVEAQKEIVVATWKLDRRSLASGATSADDVRTVAKAEAELKTRVEATASQFRDSTMRDPRRRGPTPGAPRAGQTLPEEDAMTAASKALAQAVAALEALKTRSAMPPELEALNHLLRAQAEVKQRQITRQTGAGGQGQNRQAQDLSTLFDKELARQQQTNYETPNSSEEKEPTSEDELLARIRELAKRQDELLRRQEELARQRQQLTAEELKRALETLTREQQALREQAEQMARQMSQGQPGASSPERQSEQARRTGDRNQPGQQGQGSPRPEGQRQGQGASPDPTQASGSSGSSGDGDRPGRSIDREPRAGDRASQMREVSEEMRRAASELSRQAPTEASTRGSRALDKLKDLEHQIAAGAPDEQRRAIGDMQLEARQLADAQRELSNELNRIGPGENGQDALRRVAGEQERLAERAERLRRNMERQAESAGAEGDRRQQRQGAARASEQANGRRVVGEAAQEMQRQRLAERMRQSAEQLRGGAGTDARISERPRGGASGDKGGGQ
ncbi:MAG: DUF4175 family protein, partial [Vicinamibacterales bacterium]